MPQTTYKGLEVQTTGSNVGTWGTVLNDNALSYIDLNLGGIVTKSLSSSNVTLTASESRNVILRLNGVLLANVQITTSCLGFFFVENATTGNFTITVRNSSSATSVTIPRTRVTVISDATNGCRIASNEFGSGTALPFHNSVAPSGWTKISNGDYENAAMRLTTGTVTTGGTSTFSDVMSSRTIARANIPLYTLPIGSLAISGNQSGGLARNLAQARDTFPAGSGAGGLAALLVTNVAWSDTTLSLTGGVSSGGSGTPLDFNIKYVEFAVATKA
jgi:hypothetical protein